MTVLYQQLLSISSSSDSSSKDIYYRWVYHRTLLSADPGGRAILVRPRPVSYPVSYRPSTISQLSETFFRLIVVCATAISGFNVFFLYEKFLFLHIFAHNVTTVHSSIDMTWSWVEEDCDEIVSTLFAMVEVSSILCFEHCCTLTYHSLNTVTVYTAAVYVITKLG